MHLPPRSLLVALLLLNLVQFGETLQLLPLLLVLQPLAHLLQLVKRVGVELPLLLIISRNLS